MRREKLKVEMVMEFFEVVAEMGNRPSRCEEDMEGDSSREPYVVLGVVHSGDCSSAVTCAWVYSVAHQSGVRPLLSGWLGLTSFRLSNILTTPSCPFWAAQLSGVLLDLSGLSGLMSHRPSNISTTPWCPPQAAYQSGV